MIEEQGLVSIITPTFNSAKFVAATIESVIAQTNNNWELLITDDASTDDTVSIIQGYRNSDSRIELFELPQNCGPGICRNNSIKNAKGKWIAFLDSDDLWMPDKLEKQLNFMIKNDHNFTFTSYSAIDENGSIIGSQNVIAKREVTFSDILKSNYIGCSTVIYNAEKLGKLFMPEIRKRQDYGLWYRIIKNYCPAMGMKKQLTRYRIRKESLSSSKIRLLKYQWELYRKIFGLNIFFSLKSLIICTYYSISGLKNRGL